MRVKLGSILDSAAVQAWNLVKKPSTLTYIAWPLAKISPSRNTFPEFWLDKESYFCKSYVFGFIPFGERRLYMEKVDPDKMQIQTRESDPLIDVWDHLISIQPLDEKRCYYEDTVEIKAGIFTFFVWAWANWFFRHRQKRWRKLLLLQNKD